MAIPGHPITLPESHTATPVRANSQPSLFVGRERELASLDEQLTDMLKGQGRLILVSGEPGLGKTALLNEFARRAQAVHDGLIVAKGGCNAFYGIGDPYLPFREILNALTGDIQYGGTSADFYSEHVPRQATFLADTIDTMVEHGRDLIDVFIPAAALLSRASATSLKGTPQIRFLESLVGRQSVRPGERQQRFLIQQYHSRPTTHCRAPPAIARRRRPAVDG